MDQSPSHPGRTSVKASHTDQLELLELQKLDQKEPALRHKRDSPRARDGSRFAGRVADLQRYSQNAVIADTTREVTRIEEEIVQRFRAPQAPAARIDNNQVPCAESLR